MRSRRFHNRIPRVLAAVGIACGLALLVCVIRTLLYVIPLSQPYDPFWSTAVYDIIQRALSDGCTTRSARVSHNQELYVEIFRDPARGVRRRGEIRRGLNLAERYVFNDIIYGVIDDDQEFLEEKVRYLRGIVAPGKLTRIPLWVLNQLDLEPPSGENAAYSLALTSATKSNEYWDWFSNRPKATTEISENPFIGDALRLNLFSRKGLSPPKCSQTEGNFILSGLIKAGMPGLANYRQFSFDEDVYVLTDTGFEETDSSPYEDCARFTVKDRFLSQERGLCYATIRVTYATRTVVDWLMCFEKGKGQWWLRGIWFLAMGLAMSE